MLAVKKRVFQTVKKLIPKISATEMIALQSGTTSIDRELFEGYVKPKNLIQNQQLFLIKQKLMNY